MGDAEGDDRIQAEHGQPQAEHALDRREQRAHAQGQEGEEAVGHHLLHGADVVDGQVRVEGGEGRAHGRSETGGIAGGADEQVDRSVEALGERRVVERPGRLGEHHVLGGGDDADDLDPRAVAPGLEPPAERVLAGPAAFGEGGVDHGDGAGRGGVARAEGAAGERLQAEHVFETWGHGRAADIGRAVTQRRRWVLREDVAHADGVVEGRAARERGVRDAGQRADALEQCAAELAGLFVAVALQGEVERGEQEALGAEADIDGAGPLEAAGEEAGEDEHDQREHDLVDHEQVAEAVAAAADPGAGALLELGHEVDPGGAQRGEQPAADPGDEGDGGGEEVDRPGRARVLVDGQIALLDERGEKRGGPGGKEPADDAGDGGEDEALHEHLADEAAAAGAERGAHGELLLAPGRAGDHEVGDVGAGDEQHEGDLAEEEEREERQEVGDHRVGPGAVLRDDGGGYTLVGAGVLAHELGGGDVGLGVGGGERGAGAELAEHAPHRGVAPLQHAGAVAPEGVERPGGDEAVHGEERREPGEPFGGDADDGEGAVVDADRPADDRRIAAEALLPAAMGEHDHGGAAGGLAVGGHEDAAQLRGDGEGGEGAGGGDLDPGALGGPAVVGAEVRGHGLVGEHRLHAAETLAVVLEVGEGDRVGRGPGLAALGDEHDAVGVGHRHALEEEGADDAEDVRVDGDAEGQREHDDGGVARGAGELAEGEAEVGEHRDFGLWSAFPRSGESLRLRNGRSAGTRRGNVEIRKSGTAGEGRRSGET